VPLSVSLTVTPLSEASRTEIWLWVTTRRERIEAAVEAGGKHVAAPHEAWIAADPGRGDVRVLLTGPHGFERTIRFAADEEPAVITERVRATLDE
jgi:hypothetical protein